MKNGTTKAAAKITRRIVELRASTKAPLAPEVSEAIWLEIRALEKAFEPFRTESDHGSDSLVR